MHDWRDAFVYPDERFGRFGMLLAARRPDVPPSRNRGCLALATSPDLKEWTVREPFWAPEEYYTHECPDLFRIGDWWYLVYSTFTERCMTHWRMARTLDGPWLCPANPDGGDTFDGRAFYAAKTAGEPAMRDFVPAGDGARRYAFGWLPTRDGENDTGGWQWGGNLVAHEVVQQPDGILTVRAPQTVLDAFHRKVRLQPRPILGAWTVAGKKAEADAVGRFSALSLGALPDECLIEVKARAEKGTQDFGVLLRADETLDKYYQLRVEPMRQRMVFDRWPRPGDQPFLLERPLALKPGRAVTLRIIVDGTCAVAYANDRVALSCRMYEHKAGGAGLFVTEGRVRFSAISIRTRG